MLDWAMSHPEFKTQLFRFVDVFPACRDDDDVTRHLGEYFDGVEVPRALDLGLEVAEHVPFGFGAHISTSVARRNVTRMARQFIAGSTPIEALPQLAQLWEGGEACTVDLLGEKTLTRSDAARYAVRVEEMLNVLATATGDWPERSHLESDPWGAVPRVNISVKPTALAPRFHPHTREEGLAEATSALRPVLRRAKELGATIHIDTEHDDVKDLTFELVRLLGEEFADGPQLGCVVQAYRKDSYTDVHDLVAWSASALRVPLQIRLVKGAYWDVETVVATAAGWPVPVFEHKEQTDANYERLTRYLIDHAGAIRPAFGSHNLRSLAHAIAYARARGLADGAIEVQLLYGMAEPVHVALRRMGMRVRVYAPVGELVPGMAYLVRRLLENTSNESFIRHRYAEGEELESLIAAPGVDDADLEAATLEAATEGATKDVACVPTDAVDLTLGSFRVEPHRELRRSAARGRMEVAIRRAPETFGPGFTAPVFIDGTPIETSEQIISVDPGETKREICRSGRAGLDEVERSIEVGLRAWPAWRSTSWRDRANVLFRAAALMRDRRDELSALVVFEAGKPIAEADAEVCEAIDFCEYYGREAIRLGEGAPLECPPGEMNSYRYQSQGLGVVISPWNFPLAIPAGMTTAALVAGNCVVLKPSEQTPGVAWRLVQILHEAGLPSGVLGFLPGAGEEIGPALVSHPRVSFVVFTGSKAVGLSIIEQAGVHSDGQQHVKRVIAEMGGKNAIVIDADADLDQAVPSIISSALSYSGQKCSAASRVIVMAPVFDQLIDRLVGAAELVSIGHPSHLSTLVGPLIDAEAYERVRRYQDLARSEGEVVLQREDLPDGGWYVGPTVVVVEDPRCSLATDEIFGPVLTVMRVDDFDQGITLANDTDYALTAGIFSRSPARIRRAADELRAGNVYVNRGITGATVGRQPFGGYGLSGVGSKAGGPDYLLQFLEPRVVTENTIRQGFAPPTRVDGAGDGRA